jgi:hypothetical protein
MAEEWRVEVELGDEGHGLALGDRLRSLDLDDEARERLGGNVIVTRDGSRMFLYASSEAAAREAERVISEVIRADGLEAETEVTHWDTGDHAWEDISASASEHARQATEPDDARTGVPFLVFLESHKPQILRDLGL